MGSKTTDFHQITSSVESEFREELLHRIIVLDGALGTMIQQQGFAESDFHSDGMPDTALNGCYDLLVLTKPEAICKIHRQYIEAGADIITTNTFNSNAISLAKYGMASQVGLINRTAAGLARKAADEVNAARRIWIAGSCGPTNCFLTSIVAPAQRKAAFDTLAAAYTEQIKALAEGGVNLILLETFYDMLNLKAALDGASRAFEQLGHYLPIMISVTISDKCGHLLSGESIDEVVASVGKRKDVVSIGLNCGFGVKDMIPHLRHLGKISPYPVSCHPNAGLPDELGNYRETSESFVGEMMHELQRGTVNIVGGCCGTTPEHIRKLAEVCRRMYTVKSAPKP